jgi:hypothetical protein
LKNQGRTLQNELSYYTVWSNTEVNAAEEKDVYFVLGPKEAAMDLVRALKDLCPNHGIRQPEPFYKVIKEERPTMYGWSKVCKLTSSEFVDGINEFTFEQLTADFRYEVDFSFFFLKKKS